MSPWKSIEAQKSKNFRFAGFSLFSLVLFAIALNSGATIAFGQSRIYLSASGHPNWNGACNATFCSESSPCGFVDGKQIGIDCNSCEVRLLSDDYLEKVLKMNLEAQSSIVFEKDVFRLFIEVRYSGQLSILSNGAMGSLRSGSIRLQGHGSPHTAKSAIFRNVNLQSSPLTLHATSRLQFVQSNVTWSKLLESPISWQSTPNGPQEIEFLDSSVFVLNAPLFNGPDLSIMTIDNTTMDIPYLAWLTKRSDVAINIRTKSVLSFSSQHLIYATAGSATLRSASVSDSTIMSALAPGFARFANFIIHSVTLNYSALYRLNIVTKEFFAYFSQIIDCDIPETYAFSVVSSNFTVSAPNAKLIVNSPDNSKVSIEGLTMQVAPSYASTRPFQINGNANFTPRALTTNMLWLGRDITIDELTVTDFIGKSDPNDPKIPRLSAVSKTNWKFNSVSVASVAIDLSLLKEFTYTVTNPLKGAISAAEGEAFFPELILPNFVNVLLAPSITSLQSGVWYPLFSNASGPMPTVNFGPEISISSNYEMNLKFLDFENFEKKNEKRLSFSRTPVGLAPVVEPRPCPPPPYSIGFECVEGALVAVESINNANIVFPRGTVSVIILGNLTSTTEISFYDANIYLNVTGCLNAPALSIYLDNRKDPTLQVTRHSTISACQDKRCASNVGNMPIKLIQSDKSCKKVETKIDPIRTSHNTLVALFNVDTSKCQVKWIIVGGVLGAVAIITLILTLVFTLNNRARLFIRPFSN